MSDSTIKCDKCDEEFVDSESFESHKEMSHENDSFQFIDSRNAVDEEEFVRRNSTKGYNPNPNAGLYDNKLFREGSAKERTSMLGESKANEWLDSSYQDELLYSKYYKELETAQNMIRDGNTNPDGSGRPIFKHHIADYLWNTLGLDGVPSDKLDEMINNLYKLEGKVAESKAKESMEDEVGLWWDSMSPSEREQQIEWHQADNWEDHKNRSWRELQSMGYTDDADTVIGDVTIQYTGKFFANQGLDDEQWNQAGGDWDGNHSPSWSNSWVGALHNDNLSTKSGNTLNYESYAKEDDYKYDFGELSSLAQDKIEDGNISQSEWDGSSEEERKDIESVLHGDESDDDGTMLHGSGWNSGAETEPIESNDYLEARDQAISKALKAPIEVEDDYEKVDYEKEDELSAGFIEEQHTERAEDKNKFLDDIDISLENIDYVYPTKIGEAIGKSYITEAIEGLDEEYEGLEDSDEEEVIELVTERKMGGFSNESIARELHITYGVSPEYALSRVHGIEVTTNDKVANTFFGKKYKDCTESEKDELKMYSGSDY